MLKWLLFYIDTLVPPSGPLIPHSLFKNKIKSAYENVSKCEIHCWLISLGGSFLGFVLFCFAFLMEELVLLNINEQLEFHSGSRRHCELWVSRGSWGMKGYISKHGYILGLLWGLVFILSLTPGDLNESKPASTRETLINTCVICWKDRKQVELSKSSRWQAPLPVLKGLECDFNLGYPKAAFLKMCSSEFHGVKQVSLK